MNERPRQRELETTTETKWAGGRRQKWKPRRKKMDEFLRVGFSKPEDKLGVLGSISNHDKYEGENQFITQMNRGKGDSGVLMLILRS